MIERFFSRTDVVRSMAGPYILKGKSVFCERLSIYPTTHRYIVDRYIEIVLYTYMNSIAHRIVDRRGMKYVPTFNVCMYAYITLKLTQIKHAI